jgi:hypothetical protein
VRTCAGQLQFNHGTERLPENWYKRSELDPWGAKDIAASTAQQCASYPSSCLVGGNTGEVNSFSGVNLGDISGGFVNAVEDLQDPQRLGCFISQMVKADTPSSLSNVLEGAALVSALALIDTQLVPALKNLGSCPNVPAGKSQNEYAGKFPGAQAPVSGPRGSGD